MSTTTAVLLPLLFPLGSVQLGQLLPNPLLPTLNPLVPLEEKELESDVIALQPVKPFSTQVSLSKTGRFDVGLTHLLTSRIGGQSSRYVSIEAESMQYKSLKNSDAVFRRICESPAARLWVQDMATHRKPFYLVVGMQTLQSAKIQNMELKEKEAQGKVAVPAEMTAQIPLYIGGKLAAKGFGMASGTMDGVLGIEVRRIDTLIKTKEQHMLQRQQQKTQQHTMIPALLTEKVTWQFSYERKKSGAANDNEREIEVELRGTAEFEELRSLLEAQEDVWLGELRDEDSE